MARNKYAYLVTSNTSEPKIEKDKAKNILSFKEANCKYLTIDANEININLLSDEIDRLNDFDQGKSNRFTNFLLGIAFLSLIGLVILMSIYGKEFEQFASHIVSFIGFFAAIVCIPRLRRHMVSGLLYKRTGNIRMLGCEILLISIYISAFFTIINVPSYISNLIGIVAFVVTILVY